ncbi:MAG TPA: hypothetical protein VMX33_08490 [bacterium]|nr:hypothetical protein [bacterium]
MTIAEAELSVKSASFRYLSPWTQAKTSRNFHPADDQEPCSLVACGIDTDLRANQDSWIRRRAGMPPEIYLRSEEYP